MKAMQCDTIQMKKILARVDRIFEIAIDMASKLENSNLVIAHLSIIFT